MYLYPRAQSAAEYVAVNSQSFVQTVSAATRDAQELLRAHPLLLVALLVLAVVLFRATRPRVR